MEKAESLTGFVALMDVLGFRDLVGRDDQLERVGKYAETVSSLLETTREHAPAQVEFVLFSDSVVINTRDDSPASVDLSPSFRTPGSMICGEREGKGAC